MVVEAVLLGHVVHKVSEELISHGLTEAFHHMMEKRKRSAREILIEQIKAGDKDLLDVREVDEIVPILYCYMRAAQEGAARVNLKLLARIIAGQKAYASLKADDFLYYANIVASLTPEEIALLGTMKRHSAVEHDPKNLNHIVGITVPVMDELISRGVFTSQEEFVATAKALSRTGLLLTTTNSSKECDAPCYLTPHFDKISRLASFEGLDD